MRGRPARIVLVSQDEDAADMRALVDRVHIEESVVMDVDEVWWKAFALSSVPTAIVIGADGRVAGVVRRLGEGGFVELRRLVEGELGRGRAGTRAR